MNESGEMLWILHVEIGVSEPNHLARDTLLGEAQIGHAQATSQSYG